MIDEKIKRINFLVDIYQYLNKNFVDQICFETNKNYVEELMKDHSQGGIDIPTDLERIMIEEANEFLA